MYMHMVTNRVIHGDCIDVLRGYADDSIDLVITSPPYNIGIDYDGYVDRRPWSEYYEWCRLWLYECLRVLKPDGRMALNHYLSLGTAREREAPLFRLNEIALGLGFRHHSCAVWPDRTLAKRTAWGSWLSASAPYVNSPYEGILILYKCRWRKDRRGVSDIQKEDFIRLTRGVWDVRTETRGKTPACFSLDFAEKVLKLLSYVDDIVLDPFSGSGTTAAACLKNRRQFIAIEQSSRYCRIAEDRLHDMRVALTEE
jgi:site-specific DNA-methyltransferase (adenine-specific)